MEQDSQFGTQDFIVWGNGASGVQGEEITEICFDMPDSAQPGDRLVTNECGW